jgi:hypothetical protein
VVNLPEAHNDLNRAYGKEVAHVFTRPGLLQGALHGLCARTAL